MAPRKSLISVLEARKLLGKDAKNLNDDQVIEIISTLTLMARKYLQDAGSKI